MDKRNIPAFKAIRFIVKNNHGDGLALREIFSVIRDEFNKLSRPNEVCFNSYDTLEMCQRFQVLDQESLEASVSTTCCGQCSAGEGMESSIRNISLALRSAGKFNEADMMDWSLGKIFVFPEGIADNLSGLFGEGKVTEIAARRMTRLVLGHERQHALQSAEFINEGRTNELNKMVMADIDDVDADQIVQYMSVPSEMEADQAGYDYMLSFE